MQEIIKGLYLGNDGDVAEAERRGYARLACCKDGIDSHRSMLGYTERAAPQGKEYYSARRGDVLALNLIDSEDPEMIPDEVLDAGLKFIHEKLSKGEKIFVHCNAGHSRSPVIVLMYLHAVGELPQGFNRAQHIFRTLYSEYDPGQGMKSRAHERWKSLPEFFTS